MSSIRLHPEFGVNPTIPTCFWCGKDRNEVAMLGAAYKKKAPMHMIIDYQPCEECAANMATGITCVEVDSATKLQRMAFARDGALSTIAPTGSRVVLREEAAVKLPWPQDKLDAMLKTRKAFIDAAVFQDIFGEAMKEIAAAKEGKANDPAH